MSNTSQYDELALEAQQLCELESFYEFRKLPLFTSCPYGNLSDSSEDDECMENDAKNTKDVKIDKKRKSFPSNNDPPTKRRC